MKKLLTLLALIWWYSPVNQHAGRARYQDKKQIVRDIWIGTGLLMLIEPVLSVVIPMALFASFISFTILDEESS